MTPRSSCRAKEATPPPTNWTPSSSTRTSSPGALAAGRHEFPVNLCLEVHGLEWLGAVLVVCTPASCAKTQHPAGPAAAPCWTEAPWGSLTLKCLTFSCSVLPWAWFWHWERQLFPCLMVRSFKQRSARGDSSSPTTRALCQIMKCFIKERQFSLPVWPLFCSLASCPAAACLSAGL